VHTAFIAWVVALTGLIAQQAASPPPSAPTLDYAYFKSRVQPIFLAKRTGHARCIACHGQGTPLRLQALTPGSTTFTEEQSRKNFEAVQRVARNGMQSRLLLHPLEESAGGDFYHNGGKHFTSQSDPEWMALKAWVMGQTGAGSQ